MSTIKTIEVNSTKYDVEDTTKVAIAQGSFSAGKILKCDDDGKVETADESVKDVQINSSSILSSGVANITITDNLSSTSSTEALSAKQGKVLDENKQNILSGTSGNVVTYGSTSGSVGSLTIDTAVTSASTNLIQSGAVKTAIDTKVRSGTGTLPLSANIGDIFIKYSA